MGKLFQRLLLGVVAGAGVYAVATIWLGFKDLGQSLATFRSPLLGPIILLSLTNYGLRYLKWTLYLESLGIRVAASRNVVIFLGGLSMTVTPGKVGELLKSYLLWSAEQVPMTRSAPAVVAERATDLIALLALMALGFIYFRRGGVVLALFGMCLLAAMALLSSRRLAAWVIHLITTLPGLRGARESLLTLYEGTATLFRPRPLIVATVLSLAGWYCECLGTYLVVSGFPGTSVSLMLAAFVYSAATLGGLPTPGGVGLTDGGMAALLHYLGRVELVVAGAATLIVRLSTLWLAVVVGVIALLVFRRRVGLSGDLMERLSDQAANNLE
jgi:uncharacterized protein (TIRG00374 family)